MKHLVILAVLIAGFLFLARLTIPKGPYGYDEADYMFDAGLGLRANYTDRGTLPIIDFVHEGLTRGRNPSERHALSEFARASNDVAFYRHWHGPMYYYWLIFASQFAHDEDGMRWRSVIFPILTCIVIYLGCLWITPGREGMLQAILSSALFIWSGVTVASLELAPHQFFVFWFLIGLILLAKMIAAHDRRYFWAAAVVAGFAFSTLEVTFVLVAVMLACLLLERRWLLPDWGFLWRSVALFLATVLISWPGAILKLSFLKSYLGIAYLAVFRKAPWGNIGLAETWAKRLLASPVEWTLILIALAMFLVGRQWTGRLRYLYPFLLFGFLMMLTTAKVAADAPRYSLPFLPVLEFIAGSVVASWLYRYVARETRTPREAQGPLETSIPINTHIPHETGVRHETGIPLETGIPHETGISHETRIPRETEGPLDTRIPSRDRKGAVRTYAPLAAISLAIFFTAWIKGTNHPYIEDPRNRALLNYIQANQLTTSSLLVPTGYIPTIHYYYPQVQLRSFEGAQPAPDDYLGKKFDGVLYPTVPVRFEPADGHK